MTSVKRGQCFARPPLCVDFRQRQTSGAAQRYEVHRYPEGFDKLVLSFTDFENSAVQQEEWVPLINRPWSVAWGRRGTRLRFWLNRRESLSFA